MPEPPPAAPKPSPPEATPVSPTSLESRMARLEQRVDDLSIEVKTLQPLLISVAKLELGLGHVAAAIDDVATSQRALVESLEQRAEARQQGEGQRRWQAYAIIGGFASVLLAIVAQIIITLANGGA